MLEARGLSKWMLISGILIVGFFLILAIFAPLIAPYGFDQVADSAGRLPEAGEPRLRRTCSAPRSSRPTCSRG